MANQFFDFEWSVAPGGHRWRTVAPSEEERLNRTKGAGWVLVEVDSSESNDAPRRYEPLRDGTGLFRTFASTAPTKKGVLAFANEYGLLGTTQYLDPDPQDVPDPYVEGQVVGERLSHWIEHILVMKDAVEVWDLAARKEVEGLREVQRSRKLFTEPPSHRRAERAAVEPVHDADTPSGFEFRYDYYRSPTSGSLLKDAWAFVMDVVQQHLVETGLEMTMGGDAAQGTARLYVTPTSLLGAMWLQFAEAISEQKEYGRCLLCGKPFEISTAEAGARTNRRFCTDVCKNRFHYRKRLDARRLRANGALLKEIAAQFKTTVPAVQKWLGEPKTKKKRARKKR